MSHATPQRTVDYLRISITDRCNERCLYCLPEGFTDWKPREEILRYEELIEIARVATTLGFRKFRVTGGEPLVRRDVEQFLCDLTALPGVGQVNLSTNGLRLARVAPQLAAAGIQSVNISLDAIDPALYNRITGGKVADVLSGIAAAQSAGIPRIKLNTVLMRGVNEKQIWPLIEFAAKHHLLLRFIELMPVSLTEVLTDANFFPIADAQRAIRERTAMVPDARRYGNGPAGYYDLPEFGVSVGFIGAMTNLHFCDACNKMRLTADGKIRPCLGHHGEIDLMPALRPVLDAGHLRELFLQALREKPLEHSFRDQYQPGRVMTAIGG
ncbi:MAG: GTP 3',8-cyclase MoaA [Verrucomicrobia bacterium]|nr:GTP 3',8-cyclase MoaA [Verrucomicrobiota bacterium]